MQKILILNKKDISKYDMALNLEPKALASKKDKDLYIATRIIENIILNGREKHIGVEGKPFMDGEDKYNLSNYEDYACGYVSSNGEVGVDIVKIQHFSDHFLDRIYKGEERSSIVSDIDATKAWSIKEACIKCVGIGLKGLFDVEIKSDSICAYKTKEFNYKSFEYNGYIITAVSEGKIEVESLQTL